LRAARYKGAALMKVRIPTPLLSYTKQKDVSAQGTTLAEVLVDLDRQFPGLRLRVVDEQGRMRRHMRVFVNGDQVLEPSHPVGPNDLVQLVQALSGG
jgi:hypothetical protein